jgi:hypothetical protein
MKHLSTVARPGRRAAIVIAAVLAGLAVSTAAFAATSSPGTASPPRAASEPSAAVPACTASALGAWVAVDQGNGAAGSIFFPLEFTNLSRHTCTLRGFPGVSAIGRNGTQLGSPASWDHVRPVRTVVLAPGATAHAILRWSDAAVTTAPGCHPVFTAFELRIYPPNQRSATHAAFDLESCSHAGPVYLSIEPIIPGVGTING